METNQSILIEFLYVNLDCYIDNAFEGKMQLLFAGWTLTDINLVFCYHCLNRTITINHQFKIPAIGRV